VTKPGDIQEDVYSQATRAAYPNEEPKKHNRIKKALPMQSFFDSQHATLLY